MVSMCTGQLGEDGRVNISVVQDYKANTLNSYCSIVVTVFKL